MAESDELTPGDRIDVARRAAHMICGGSVGPLTDRCRELVEPISGWADCVPVQGGAQQLRNIRVLIVSSVAGYRILSAMCSALQPLRSAAQMDGAATALATTAGDTHR